MRPVQIGAGVDTLAAAMRGLVMKIIGETREGYSISCHCGARFSDTGAVGAAICLICGAAEHIDQLVVGWWQKAGSWAVPTATSQKANQPRTARTTAP